MNWGEHRVSLKGKKGGIELIKILMYKLLMYKILNRFKCERRFFNEE